MAVLAQDEPEDPGLRVAGEAGHVAAEQMGEVFRRGLRDCVVWDGDGALFVEECGRA